jgi:thymidine kinase
MLRVYTGPMYAGKSTALLDALEDYGDVLVFKPDTDDRYAEDEVVTHDGRSVPAAVVPSSREGVETLEKRVLEERPAVVGIDEAQFFDDALVDAVERLIEEGINVVTVGLEEDFADQPFGPMPGLVENADVVKRLTAECDACGGAATKTQRLIDGEPAPADAPQVDVGADRYEARCPDCHEVG